MKTKTILLCTVALTLGACTSQSGARYTPRPDVAQQNYTAANHTEDRMDKKSYKQYEDREPCQNYRDLPRGMVDKCAKVDEELELAVVERAPEPIVQTYVPKEEPKVLPIVRSYTVLFDHDKSSIRTGESATLDQAMREIDKYDPRQVTVTGYTDSSGKADYNQTLSHEREQAVSKALLARGIENQVLAREARGEYDQAVQTADGVKNQDNRRVVIDFRR
jgi:outer membrane protein OmpA-like peptidoglycan-associated protein